MCSRAAAMPPHGTASCATYAGMPGAWIDGAAACAACRVWRGRNVHGKGGRRLRQQPSMVRAMSSCAAAVIAGRTPSCMACATLCRTHLVIVLDRGRIIVRNLASGPRSCHVMRASWSASCVRYEQMLPDRSRVPYGRATVSGTVAGAATWRRQATWTKTRPKPELGGVP